MPAAGDIKNPCKCAGCSLQKATIYIAVLNLITHGVFITVVISFHQSIYDIAVECGFQGDKNFYPTVVIEHNSFQANQRDALTTYLWTQYIILPCIMHCVLFYGSITRSYFCCYTWMIYTSQYLVADVIFKGYLFEWFGMLYFPFWLFDLYCMWILKRFKQEIRMYGKISLPRRVVPCPYYFRPPPDYDPKSNFITA